MNESPLSNLHIINTRPKHQADMWTKRLQAEGASVIALPAIEIIPSPKKWVTTITPLSQYQHLIFISQNAVTNFFTHYHSNLPWPKQITVSAIGKETAKALRKHNIQAISSPGENSEALLAMEHLNVVNKQKILLVKGSGGRRLIASTLRKRGALVQSINVYRRQCPSLPSYPKNLWQETAETIILITSQAAIDNIFNMLANDHKALQSAAWFVLSKRLAAYAQKKGVKKTVVTNGTELIKTLTRYKQGLAHE